MHNRQEHILLNMQRRFSGRQAGTTLNLDSVQDFMSNTNKWSHNVSEASGNFVLGYIQMRLSSIPGSRMAHKWSFKKSDKWALRPRTTVKQNKDIFPSLQINQGSLCLSDFPTVAKEVCDGLNPSLYASCSSFNCSRSCPLLWRINMRFIHGSENLLHL